MGVLDYIEGWIGYLIQNYRGHDKDLFYNHENLAGVPETLIVESDDIAEGQIMPDFTISNLLNFENISPHLKVGNLPENTASIAIIMEDPDCPPFNATHFFGYLIKPDLTEFPRGSLNKDANPEVTMGTGIMNETGYVGPRPPINHGPHRYIFEFYAIDADATTALEKVDKTKKFKIGEFAKIVHGHILCYGKLAPYYER